VLELSERTSIQLTIPAVASTLQVKHLGFNCCITSSEIDLTLKIQVCLLSKSKQHGSVALQMANSYFQNKMPRELEKLVQKVSRMVDCNQVQIQSLEKHNDSNSTSFSDGQVIDIGALTGMTSEGYLRYLADS
jgi:hypothetical protein